MGRITINDVKDLYQLPQTYDIVNAIRNENPGQFGQYVPLANAENVSQVGAGIMINQTIQNDFITTLVDRIGLVVIRQTLLANPLKKFKKGALPMGRTIEEIFVDITEAHMFDQEVAEQEVFKREIPDVKTLFHEVNRKEFYKQTISREQLTQAFTSWGAFDDFVSGIIRAIYNSAEVDEYKYMKLLIDNYYSKGLFKVVKIDAVNDGTTAQQLVKKMRALARKMTLPQGSRDFNSLGVHTRSFMDTIHVFIDADLEAELDVEVLARAFNMDKTTFMGHVTVIDGFASAGLEAVIVDENFFMVYDKLMTSETIRNPQGLYWNQWFHVWQVLSTSRFANAVALVSGAVKEVTSVILDPSLVSLKAGKKMKFNAYVRQTDTADHEIVYAVVAGDRDTELLAGTTISSVGELELDEAQKGQLKVTATVTAGTEPYDVVGESIVTVIPLVQ